MFRATDEKWLSSGEEYHFHTVCHLFIRENKQQMRRERRRRQGEERRRGGEKTRGVERRKQGEETRRGNKERTTNRPEEVACCRIQKIKIVLFKQKLQFRVSNIQETS